MATETTNFPRESTMREISDTLHAMSFIQMDDTKFSDVKKIIRSGFGRKAFPIGTKLRKNHSVFGGIDITVVGHDQIKSPYDPDLPTMTLLMEYAIDGYELCNSQALYYCAEPLSPGNYYFTLPSGYDEPNGGGKSIQFTTTKQIPSGGIIVFDWRYNTQATSCQIRTYNNQKENSPIETLNVSEGRSGTNLGIADGSVKNMNSIRCARYGNNNYKESPLRQWLGSTEKADKWWTPQTIFSLRPKYSNQDGFLAGFDDDFLSAIAPVDVTTATNYLYEVNGETSSKYTTRDIVFLPSITEITGVGNGSVTEGVTFEFYNSKYNASTVKYDISSKSTPIMWWFRSPYVSDDNRSRYVAVDGTRAVHYSSQVYGVCAAFVIY